MNTALRFKSEAKYSGQNISYVFLIWEGYNSVIFLPITKPQLNSDITINYDLP